MPLDAPTSPPLLGHWVHFRCTEWNETTKVRNWPTEFGKIYILLRGKKQCCESELIFFLDSDPQFFLDSDSNPYTNILTQNFLKWCLSLLLYVFWNLYDREKSFPTEKKSRETVSFNILFRYRLLMRNQE
jgi:hypothetical protein